jgi:hypothetical protein
VAAFKAREDVCIGGGRRRNNGGSTALGDYFEAGQFRGLIYHSDRYMFYSIIQKKSRVWAHSQACPMAGLLAYIRNRKALRETLISPPLKPISF